MASRNAPDLRIAPVRVRRGYRFVACMLFAIWISKDPYTALDATQTETGPADLPLTDTMPYVTLSIHRAPMICAKTRLTSCSLAGVPRMRHARKHHRRCPAPKYRRRIVTALVVVKFGSRSGQKQ